MEDGINAVEEQFNIVSGMETNLHKHVIFQRIVFDYIIRPSYS